MSNSKTDFVAGTGARAVRPKFLAGMLFFGMVAACMDTPNLQLGGLSVKIAFIVFPIYVLIIISKYGVRMNAGDALCAGAFLLSIIPSVINSVSPIHSVAFLFGAGVCVGAMFSFSVIVSRLGADAADVLVKFYRMTVVVSVLAVLLRLQERGCYTFYEPSYWTIALIPYFCITFYRLSIGPPGCANLDCVFVLLAVLASQSFSMVLWAFVVLLWMRFKANKIRLGQIVALVLCVVIGGGLAVAYDQRTQTTLSVIQDAQLDAEGFVRVAIHIAGNRVQRICLAWDVAMSHFWDGVGLGVFKQFVASYLDGDDFSVMGMVAWDFILESNAVCVYLEMLAEGGFFGLLGYVIVLYRVYKVGQSRVYATPMLEAFVVTMSALIIESSYLRPYVWALYGTVLGLSRVVTNYTHVQFCMPKALREEVALKGSRQA
ncbi:MAG: O-antigen ligase family protein [Verrucomicrobiota bacterium]